MAVKLADLKNAMAKAKKHPFGALPRKADTYPKMGIQKLETLPAPGINSLIYKAQIKSQSTSEIYMTSVQFFGMEFSPEKKPNWIPVEFNGKPLYYAKPSVSKNEVKLYCQCQDYRFRFEKPNFDRKGQIGNYRRYTRKTPPPPAGYPYANPQNVPGYCKHVHSLLMALNRSQLVGN